MGIVRLVLLVFDGASSFGSAYMGWTFVPGSLLGSYVAFGFTGMFGSEDHELTFAMCRRLLESSAKYAVCVSGVAHPTLAGIHGIPAYGSLGRHVVELIARR
ncbi:uncharacterized protein AMSG_05192 [Thecamonas trahens ATCC 50062]|uniref:Uncharacterized protein n=1 Tax=Thecamonas trahens ATCC 50062 TaxID=461836 RepID=A0A0L0DA30_THETB|nr:hypothetical protein AMSG_05192 [Thecamonas trahens ATCC 50062]KNC49209.1 hypothetical protein AMSG_05192 [Thecamonas trahens ATCC 50062]|eukprot:XP_013757932.1 hypothetical protein AMSG_05192 [Thecamonas trahens ATCC 50062]